MSDIMTKSPGWHRSWDPAVKFVTKPSVRIADSHQQQKARLTAGVTFVAAMLATLAFLVFARNSHDWQVALAGLGPLLAVSYTSYFLTKTRFVQAGSILFIVGLCAAPFVLILQGSANNPGETLLIFLPLSLTLGSFILEPPILLTILLLSGVGILALPILGIPLTGAGTAAVGSILTLGFSLVLLGGVRRRAEQRSLEDLSRANADLDALGRALEAKVTERTEALKRRTAQLEAASFVSRQTASILDPEGLLNEAVQLIEDRFDFYHAGIFLLDTTGQYAVLHAASSEGGRRMLVRGHRLEVGRQGIVGYVAFQKRARIALDVGEEAVYFSNPDLPETRSEMALPLIVRGKVLGVLDIQSIEPAAFTSEDVSAIQSLADQIALALDNSRLMAESQAALKQLQAMTSENSYRLWREKLRNRQWAFRYTPVGVAPHKADIDGDLAASETDSNCLRVPINLRGTEIGHIIVKRRGQAQGWSEQDQTLAAEISTQVGLALDNARLLEELEGRASRELTISRASSNFTRTTDLDTLLQLALREFHQLPSVDEVSVFISPEGRAGGLE